MRSPSLVIIHIALLPFYITLAVYLNLIPPVLQPSLSSLLKLAKSNALNLNRLAPLTTTSLFSTSPSNMSSLKFVPRRSEERGNADHGWLKTFHTFSFASYAYLIICLSVPHIYLHIRYQDFAHEQYGSLGVINEDRVEPRTGFGTHSHREFEIFSYVVSGELQQ